ncbi:MAG: NAD(P)H:quinone oxidoreductase [Gammaproteobacteria bacterium]|nr:NAD(P)H:quinone oxidoreductase [Gammaproteobacteria bacterium]
MEILIVYHSRLGSVQKMARLIGRGVESVEGCNAVLRSVAEVSADGGDSSLAESGDSFVENSDLQNCSALILGSPARFGNMSASIKYFLDDTSALWMSGTLAGKVAAVFTSSSSMHGGQESTLLSMLNPLLHHGMVICGLPYTEAALHKTTTGGTPYGASHFAGASNSNPISEHEKSLCIALGKRVAKLTVALQSSE